MRENQERINLILRNIKLLTNQLKIEINDDSLNEIELIGDIEFKVEELKNYAKLNS